MKSDLPSLKWCVVDLTKIAFKLKKKSHKILRKFTIAIGDVSLALYSYRGTSGANTTMIPISLQTLDNDS